MLFPRKQEPHKVLVVKDNTPQILQNWLENTVFFHQATLAPNLKLLWDGPSGKEEDLMEEAPCSKKDSEESHQNADDLSVVDKIVQNIASGLRLKCVVQWFGYCKTDETAKLPHHIPQHLIVAYWRRFDKREKQKAFLKVE